MSRIKKTGESIKRKLVQGSKDGFSEGIEINEEGNLVRNAEEIRYECSMPTPQLNIKPARQQDSKKKVTFYLPFEIESKLNEICAKRLMRNQKEDKSSLICRAIELLWKEEKNYEI